MSRFLVFANGEADDLTIVRKEIECFDRIVCADGGAARAMDAGILPDVVIGDFDSLTQRPDVIAALEANKATLLRYNRDKDETDLELALDYCVREGATEIDICCALGGRLDHLLGNVLLLTLPRYEARRLRLTDGSTHAEIVRAGESLSFESTHPVTFSLLPFAPETVVTITGAKWELKEERLPMGTPRGISNETDGRETHISAGRGMLIAIYQAPLRH